MSNLIEAAVYHDQMTLKYEEIELMSPPEGWVQIKVHYCGICGTDLNIYGGGHPRAKGPLVIGHEFSGEVYGHPKLADGSLVTVRPILSCGSCEACLGGIPHVCEDLKLIGIDRDGGMAQYVQVPVDEVFPLPKAMSSKKGALVEPFAVSVHAIRESSFKPGDTAVVFGAGPIGLCTAISLHLLGARDVMISEVHPYRQQIAEELGFKVMNPSDGQQEISIAIKEYVGSAPDVVFDCAAHPSVASIITDVPKIKGEIVLVGTYKTPAPIDLQSITFRELSVRGTRVYTKKDYEIAIDLLSKEFSFEKLITHEISLKEIETGMKTLLEGKAIKVLVSL